MSLADKFKDINIVDYVIDLSKSVNLTYYDMGEALFYIKNSDIIDTVDDGAYSNDKASWKRFCEDKLEISYRTAQYWLNIYEYFYSMNIDKDELATVGWSKSKEIVDVTDVPQHLDTMLKYAKEHSIQELKDYIINYKVKYGINDGEPLNTYTSIKFKLPAYQSEVVDNALSMAKEIFGTTDNNDSLANILLDWTQMKTLDSVQVDLDENLL